MQSNAARRRTNYVGLLHVEGDNFVTGVSNEVATLCILLTWSYTHVMSTLIENFILSLCCSFVTVLCYCDVTSKASAIIDKLIASRADTKRS